MVLALWMPPPWQGASFESAAKFQTARISLAVRGNGTDTSERPEVLETLHVGIKSYGRFLSCTPFSSPIIVKSMLHSVRQLAVWPLIPPMD